MSLPARRSGRAFCGDAYPGPRVRELEEDGREVVACYLVHRKERRTTKANKPFLKLLLGDATGSVDAMVWDDAERLDGLVGEADVVGVRGRVGSYQERLQITVEVMQPLEVEDDELALFLPCSPRDRGVMERELDATIASVSDGPLRTLLNRCLGRGTAAGRAFRLHPAAKRNHHAYLCGLLEHSLSVAGACDRLAGHYAAQGAPVDRDLLVAGALLHDLGKVRELSAGRTFAYTDEGQLLGHILLGLQMVQAEAERISGLPRQRLVLLLHLIASHQGRLEWASPKVPQTLEAMILHYADDLDAKMNSGLSLLGDTGEGEWSGYDRHLERALFRPAPVAPSAEVEPVEPAELAGALIDMFRG